MDEPTMPPRDEHTWIQTYTGKQAWPLNPMPQDIDIMDIAHALALANRYTGHTLFPYSVAQHCVLMHDAMKKAEYSRIECFWALMHDASEAYLCYIARPVKNCLHGYLFYEENLMKCIAAKYNLSWPMPDIVKQMDLAMLATERFQLMGQPPIPWTSTEGAEPIPCKIEEWDWKSAKMEFLIRFGEYFGITQITA